MKNKSSNALSHVTKFFPDVTKVTDADEDLEVEVTSRDLKTSKKKDHAGCALAVAAQTHIKKCTGAVVSASTAYIIKGTEATRYLIPERARKEIVSFDRGATFEPGDYTLKAPKQSSRLGHMTGSHGPRVGRRRIQRKTMGIRERISSRAL